MSDTVPEECRELQNEFDAIHQMLDNESIPVAPNLTTRVQHLINRLPGSQLQQTLDQLNQLIDDLSQADEMADDE